ncbi:MAG: hypothetical protein K2M82_01360, partial [Lachnospiraceae bacterium]|nr:hypothetical protein [Lachnospiraceae bacterium]
RFPKNTEIESSIVEAFSKTERLVENHTFRTDSIKDEANTFAIHFLISSAENIIIFSRSNQSFFSHT